MDLSDGLTVAGIVLTLIGAPIGTVGVLVPNDPITRPDWQHARQDI